MRLKNWLAVQVILFSAFGFAQQDPVIRIPLQTVTKPAADLVDSKGQKLSYAQIIQMSQSGQDTSLLSPVGDDYWQNKEYTAVDSQIHAELPNNLSSVEVTGLLGANRELGFFSAYVSPVGKNQKYILTLGLQVHSSLLKSALLRKLGYYQLSPKYVSKIRIDFKSTQEKQDFIKTAFCENGPDETATDCLSLAPFKSADNQREFLSEAGERSLFVHGAYLEKMSSTTPSLFDGLLALGSGQLQYAMQNRTARSLLVPFVLGDLGESLNRVSVQPVFVRDGWAFINFDKSYYFENTGSDDVRWMLRKVAALTDQDWKEIIDASAYPEGLKQLVQAKLMLRAQNMLETFFRPNESVRLNAQIPQLNYNSKDGYVVAGKVVTEYIPGFPQRFSHGDRPSPFDKGDFGRYMKIKAQSAVMDVAIEQLSDKLKLTQTQILNQNIKGLELTEQGYRPIGSVTGVQAGLNFGATRLVTTGTFYGSSAAVQLVDSVSVSAAVGLMKIVDELGGIRNNFGANVGYQREFTHVRPLDSLKETKNIPWSQVFVPSHLKKMASPLKEGQLTGFISALKIGEVFTITDSVGIMGQMGTSLGLDALVAFSSTVQPQLVLSAGGGKVILRQTQITRTDAGFQVFIRDQNTKVKNLTFDVNYFINLLKIKYETKNTDLHTDAFILNFNGEFVSKGDNGDFNFEDSPELQQKYEKQKQFGSKIAGALRALIFDSTTEPLYANFRKQQFEIDHGLKTKEIQTKILWFRSTQMEEEHLLKVFKPDVQIPDQVTTVNAPIEIVTFKKGELRGKDLLGFGLNVVDGVLSNKYGALAPQLSQDVQNPSQMPFGKAEWRIVRTDTDLHPERPGALPSVGLVQNVWGGWSLKKKDLNKILERVQSRLKGTELENQKLFADHSFDQVQKIDFFRVTSNLSLLPGALDKLKSLLISPDVQGQKVDKAKFLGKLFQKLSEMGGNKARPEDKVIFKNLMTMMGAGDEQLGQQIYQSECQMQKNSTNGEGSGQSQAGSWVYGTYYDCLQPWTEKIIKTARQFQGADLRKQNRLMTELVYILEEKIPLGVLLKTLDRANYLFFVEVTGFRTGDEDGDLGVYVSNVLGEPEKKHPYSNGLINIVAEKSKIISVELDRTQASFQ